MSNQPAIINSHRMEETVTESKGEDQSQPATNATVRILAVRADAGFTQLHMGLEHLNDKIDHVDDKLCQRIDGVENNLGQRIDNLGTRIDGVENNLGQRIDNLKIELGQQISNLGQRIDNSNTEHKVEREKLSSEINEKFAERAKSDKFLIFGFAIALLSVFAQMAGNLFG